MQIAMNDIIQCGKPFAAETVVRNIYVHSKNIIVVTA
jgi:hypothetical protein